MFLKQVIEALVFASQKPLPAKEIVAALRSALDDSDEELVRELAKSKEADVLAALEELKGECVQENRAYQVVEQISGWAIVTKPEYAVWVRQLYPESKPARLSGPALETLAIIAYRQPITRADIEAVRGVAVDGVMQSLLDRSLVRIAGRADVPGRPLLYETTQVFMEHFGLRNLQELPNSDELRRVNLPKAPEPQPETEKKGKGKKAETGVEPAPPSDPGAEAPSMAEATPGEEAAPTAESAPDEETSLTADSPASEQPPPASELSPEALLPSDSDRPVATPPAGEASSGESESPDPQP